jgi:nucleoside-diphosphate-sugar epimerase
MRVFVAGATGVLGRRIVPRLVAAGHEVTAATRSAAKADALRDAGAAPVLVDVFDREALRRAVADAAPDLVMHQLTDLRGGSTEANARIRVTGTRNLVDAAAGAGVPKMVAQSISWVYQAGDGPADESAPLDLNAAAPRSGTVQGVAALEAAVREMPEWVVLRYGLLYGPGTWYAVDGMYAGRARAGRLAADENVSSFVHAADATVAAVESLDWPSGVVNVCDDEPAPGREWVPAFCRAVGAPVPPPAPAAMRGRDGWARGADNRHARNDLGWKPRYPSWRSGFGEPPA